MCYFEQTLWSCGYWRWGHFRQQCNKEYRMGETCGLKLVYITKNEPDVCKLCHDIEKKQRRYDKMARDVERWQREGNRRATIERTCGEMREVADQIHNMRAEHYHRTSSLGQARICESIRPKSRQTAAAKGAARVSIEGQTYDSLGLNSPSGHLGISLELSKAERPPSQWSDLLASPA
ncbi:uncharacterized protein BBA_05030 [Beauveria bassiana ARSEF 2860]|uniref:Uncharacterized protein n=2 Tax=Beauveria bassiana TaxID=176275 RepID=J4KNP4_BEAB2|nr:uncharacterized protein BBA_05030 [Beauveria bassiana ARSEF 2860]EJP66059.1 hypothetical protein BBA_05030 [Beauveria bassiana ARSEF 2860]